MTSELRPGDRLLTITPRASTKSMVSPLGVMAGIVYGDGCSPEARPNSAVLTLYGEKTELAHYFPQDLCIIDDEEVRIHSLPSFMKRPPDLEEIRSYLLGWLAGYVATDGSVSRGQVVLSSTRRESIELAQTVAARVGIASYAIGSYPRTTHLGDIDYDTIEYRLQLRSSDLPMGFLLRTRHAQAGAGESGSLTWRVEEVIPGTGQEEVFCVEVPEYENFTLEDWINVKNCEFRTICAGSGVPDNDHGAPA